MPFQAEKQIVRIGPLAAIILLHALFFYALQSAIPRQAAQAMPRELFVSLITPVPTPAPAPVPIPEAPTPPAATPTTMPAVKKPAQKPVRAPRPIAPAAKPTPLPQSAEPPIAAAPLPDPPAPAPHSTPAPPAATASTAAPPPKTVSGVEYVQAPQPEYPAIARRMGEEGKVILRILVNEQGQPARIEVRQSSGYARLDDAARRAALRALFKPHLEDGRAVAVYALIPINFSMQ